MSDVNYNEIYRYLMEGSAREADGEPVVNTALTNEELIENGWTINDIMSAVHAVEEIDPVVLFFEEGITVESGLLF